MRESLSNVVSCHEVPTITGRSCSSRSPAVFYHLSSSAKYDNTWVLSLLYCQCQITPLLSTLNPFIIRSGYGNTPWVVPPHLMGIMGGPGIGLRLIAMWVHAWLHTHADIAANYHHWAWGGWSSQEAGTFGAPAGHYQFQVFVSPQGLLHHWCHTFSGVCFCVCDNAENGAIYIDSLQVKHNSIFPLSLCKALNNRIKPKSAIALNMVSTPTPTSH